MNRLTNKATLLIADTDAIAEGEAQNCLFLLDDTERSRLAHLGSMELYISHLVGHALLRRALADLLRREPESLVFGRKPGGKPFLVRLENDPDLRFSLSRTTGMVALALTVGCEIGVDLETAAPERSRLRLGEAETLARDHFSADEAALVLRESDPEHQHRLFLRLWVAKEAALKTTGQGIAGLKNAIVDLTAQTIRITSTGHSATEQCLKLHEDNADGCFIAATAERPLLWTRLPTLSSLLAEPLTGSLSM